MDNEKIGAFIANIRKTKNMTQKDLADKLNITDKAVSKWERGISLPDISILPQLSQVLGVEISELLNGEMKSINNKDIKNTQENVLTAFEYAEKSAKSKTKNIRKISALIISSTFIIAIIVCLICDTAISNTLTWSLFPISSIVYTWPIIIPITLFGKKGLLPSLLILSMLTLPFLNILDKLIDKTDLITPLGSRIALITLAYLWIIYTLLHILKIRKLAVSAISTLILIPINIFINYIVSYHINDAQIFDVWDLISCSVFLITSIFLFIFDFIKKNSI